MYLVSSSYFTCRAWAVGSLTLLFVLSVTWSSGLMFLSGPSLLLAYLFSSLNTAQALLITILHCTLARKVSLSIQQLLHNYICLLFMTKRTICVMVCRVRRIMADACVSLSAVQHPHPALQTQWKVLRFAPIAATQAAKVEELQQTDRCATMHFARCRLCLCLTWASF